MAKFEIGTPVIYNGKFANVVGRDNGTEQAIIEFCDHRDGKLITVAYSALTADQESIDQEIAFQKSIGLDK